MSNLVIVESPTKAKTISRFLSKDFSVETSYGHIRDLPKSKLGVDVENNFQPEYIIPKDSQKTVAKLKKQAAKAEKIFFATDEDREGEAIAWHLLIALQVPEDKTQRITFHEITKEAINNALKQPREINLKLVNAQQARRILDRLVGYKLSPLLWKKVYRGLSAGRVQSVTVRLIVEREREIEQFKKQEYWLIEGEFFALAKPDQTFIAKLHKIDDRVLDKLAIKNKETADNILTDLKKASFQIIKVSEKELSRSPLPPFQTSTLQQTANRVFSFSARQTMFLAQQLYEGIELGSEGSVGLITYMRTDSLNLAEKFLQEAQLYLQTKFGQNYTLKEPRRFKTKSKIAQEAHEAIRPTDITREPEKIKDYLSDQQYKLYRLIWQRALACQMPAAQIKATTVDISDNSQKYLFRATGSQIVFNGWLEVLPNSNSENILPALKEREAVQAKKITSQQKITEPPARYSEAGLIRTLEKYGIGRPSTYAPTINTIIERHYVEKIDRRLKPTDIGILVNDLLVKHFPKIIDYKFTAHMEDELDEIAQGKIDWLKVIDEFYQPFIKNLMAKEKELSKKEITEEKTEEKCEKCGSEMIIKIGRFGKFLACSKYPDCKNTKPLKDNNRGGKEAAKPELVDEKCPDCGAPLQKRTGRFGPFLGCSKFPECKYIKKTEDKTGAKCPECGKGDIVTRRSRRGRTFYSCNRYPDCKFALWQRPTGDKCPKCGSLLVYAAKDQIKCSNKECQRQSNGKTINEDNK